MMNPSTRKPVTIDPGLYWVRRTLPDGTTAQEPAKLTEHAGWHLLGDDRWYPSNSPDVVPLRALPVPSDI